MPYYVIGKNIKKNELIVSNKIFKTKNKKNIIAEKCNFIGILPKHKDIFDARVRYRERLFKCKILSIQKGKLKITTESGDFTATSGQSIVLYKGTECVGGGIII